MPLVESQPDALARVYATSLFELAEADGGQSRAEEILGELEDILELARADASFSEFLASRVLTAEKREGALKKMLAGRCQDLTLRFLLLLNEKNRLGHLPAITGALDQLVQDRFGRVEVDVFTASPIGSEEVGLIKQRLKAALGKDPIIHPYTDTAMIGGIKVRIGDRLIDGSISTRLRQMRDRLSREGNAEIRAKMTDLIDDAGA
ncbi:MAG: ATP synthase subunit delta [Phycisphaeraceae bacterium]|nr:MAG: ATP synthase subunit delta [Phycisphaeraceae bacterium]